MAKKIAWTGQAKADLRAIDRQTAMRILHGLARFTQIEEGDIKCLQDIDPPEFRLRAAITAFAFAIAATPSRFSPSSTAARRIAEAVLHLICIPKSTLKFIR
jgi:hypothetical protein